MRAISKRTSTALIALILALVLSAVTLATGFRTIAQAADGPEQIPGGHFTESTDPWWGGNDIPIYHANEMICTDVPAKTANAWSWIVGIDDLQINEGKDYHLKFKVSGTQPAVIRVLVQ